MEQITMDEVLQKVKQPQRPDLVDPITLPGFAESKAYLESKGLPWGWIIKTADTSDKYTIYLKHGRPFYKSDCPNYKGYWADGVHGAVDCAACTSPLPSLMWDKTCKGEFTRCPFFGKEETDGQNNQGNPAPEL